MGFAQVSIQNIQIASTIVSVDAATPNDPTAYTWSEVNNTKQGVHISLIPAEKAEIYLQQNNSWINYNTWNWGYMNKLDVSYDGGNWQTIISRTIDASGWISCPFSTLGHHTISVKWIGTFDNFTGLTYWNLTNEAHTGGHNGFNKDKCIMSYGIQDKQIDYIHFCSGHLQMLFNCSSQDGGY